MKMSERFYKIVGYISIIFALSTIALSIYNTINNKSRQESARDRYKNIISGEKSRNQATQNEAENIASELLRQGIK